MRPKHLVQRVQLVKVEPRFRDEKPTSMLIMHFAASSEACHMFRRRALNSDLTGMAKSEHCVRVSTKPFTALVRMCRRGACAHNHPGCALSLCKLSWIVEVWADTSCLVRCALLPPEYVPSNIKAGLLFASGKQSSERKAPLSLAWKLTRFPSFTGKAIRWKRSLYPGFASRIRDAAIHFRKADKAISVIVLSHASRA